MENPVLLNEKIVDILYKQLLEEQLDLKDRSVLDQWLNSSSYNRSLFDDITDQQALKNELIAVYPEDKSQFWNIVLGYRTAMHNGLPAPAGNFWKRCITWIQKTVGLRRS